MSKILVVDDEQQLLDIVKKRLTSEGYEVYTTDSCDDALEYARCQRPAIIILDVMMPETSGTEFAKVLKDDPATSEIPIIFLTALISRKEAQYSDNYVGKRYFVAKPFNGEDLVEIVKKLEANNKTE